MDPVCVIPSDIGSSNSSKEALGIGWISWMVGMKSKNLLLLDLSKNKSRYKQEEKTTMQ